MSGVPIRGSRILVTGGSGTIGSTVVDQLVAAGAEDVVVLDNLVRGSTRNLDPALESGVVSLVRGDVADTAVLAELSAGRDLVFHLAALRITLCAAEPRQALYSLVDGTFNVFEAAQAAGVKRLIFSSSASVYGMAEEFPTNEHHHPYNNDTLYGGAKVFGEQLQASFYSMYGLEGISLRYFNVYGPRMDVHGRYTEVLVRWMGRIERGEPPLIFGDGLQTLDLVYTSDIARANLSAAEADIPLGTYNVASGTEISLRDLASALCSAMDRPDLTPEFGPERAVNPVARRLADTRAAAKDLGFVATVTLETGLRELVTWWRDTTSSGQEPLE